MLRLLSQWTMQKIVAANAGTAVDLISDFRCHARTLHGPRQT